MKDAGGFEFADLIQVWIGFAVSMSAFFGWLLWRVTRLSTYQSMPNVKVIVGRGHAHAFGIVSIHLEGPTADRWAITRITITKPRDVQFLRHYQELNDYGEGVTQFGEPVGRTLDHPPLMVGFSSLEQPLSVTIKLSLKAFPKITSLHPITISKKD